MASVTHAQPSHDMDEQARPLLKPYEAAGLTALAVVHFLFLHGPIWRHAWTPNASIAWSYLPIPFLVALVLLRGGRLSWTSWGLGTLQVATAKFVITAFVLVGLWAATNPTRTAVATSDAPSIFAASAPGPVVVPNGAVEPTNASTPIAASVGSTTAQSIALPVGGRLHLKSSDHRMHTVLAPAAGVNVPVVPGPGRTFVFAEVGTYELRCGVHPTEPHVTVTVK